ncbi:MAG: hypothetical protein KF791_04090 [Verrucomicrobiae bacterium]|nr:hypothetical protein [Verrucomicrobiae bacterium]
MKIPEDPLPVHWRFRESGTAETLRAVVHAPSGFVAVGGDEVAVILTSPDGEHWLRQEAGDASGLADVIFAGGRFVAIGGQRPRFLDHPSTATILISSDGIAWERQAVPVTNALVSLAHGNGKFVAVGMLGTLLSSPDGIHWSVGTSPTRSSMVQVAFGAGRFIAIGHTTLLCSTNGVEWELLRSPNVTEGGWKYEEVSFSSPAIVHAAGRWLFRGRPGLGDAGQNPCRLPTLQAAVVSSDAESWSPVWWHTSLRRVSRLRHLGGKFVAVGGANDYCGHAFAIQASSDGLNWSEDRVVTSVPFDGTDWDLHGYNDVAWDGHAYVVVGTQGRIIHSVTEPVPLEIELNLGVPPELTIRGPAGELIAVEFSDDPTQNWSALPLKSAGEWPDGVAWETSPANLEPYPWVMGRLFPAVLDPVVRIAVHELSSLPGARFYRARTLSATATAHLLLPIDHGTDP